MRATVFTDLLFSSFQAGAYLPFFRAHAHLDTKRREPWLFEDKYKNLMREAIRHRYALLPYWYTLFHEASKSGSPIVTYVTFEKQILSLVQTSNFSCAEPNVNDLSSLFELFCIKFGT